MSQILKFEITDYELQDISDSQFMRLRTKIVSSGMNKHKLPIKLDTIKRASASLFGKPLLFKYNEQTEDFEGHMPTEISCGVYIDKNSFSFVQDEQNPEKQWLVADCVIWKHYYPEVVKVFEKREEVAISMEIEVLEYVRDENGFNEIAEFVFRGVTLLGQIFNPAIPNANAMVLSFSEMQEEAMKEFNIQTDVNLESSDAIKEAGQEESSICGELDTQTVVESDKEGEGMKPIKTEFEAEVAKDVAGEEEMAVKEDIECAKENIECVDVVESAKNVECVDMPESETEDGEKEEESESEVTVVCEETVAKSEFEKMEQDFTAKIEAMETELTTLREFKATVEKQEYEAKVDFAIDAVRADLTSEQVDEWREKSKEFSSVDAFTNSLKAFAYDVRVAKNPTEKEEFSRMEVITETITKTQSKSIWA